MLKISKLADYSVVILSHMAQSDQTLMTASGLAVATNMPEPTVAKILKLLTKSGILTSTRGVNGGYSVNVPPQNLSVAQIITAVDGPVSLTACVDHSDDRCNFEQFCTMKGRWDGVNSAIQDALENVKLYDMMTPNYKNNANTLEAIEERL